MSRSTIGGAAAGVAILCLASWAMGGAEADYKALFAKEEKAAAEKGAQGAAEFAAKLVESAKSIGGQKDLQILLCEKAYEYGMRGPAGYAAAIEAMKLLMEAAPEKKGPAQDKLIEASQTRFAKSAGEERKLVGEEVIELLAGYGDGRAAARQYADAITFYKKASTIATSVGSGRTAELADKIKQANAGVEAEARLTALKNKLRDNPKTASARTELILAYVGESDNPAEAVKLLNEGLDEKLRTYVPLAAKPVGELEDAACLEMANWYADIAEKASPVGKVVLLGKSKACCQRYLDLHPNQDAARLKGAMLLDKVNKAANKASLEVSNFILVDLGKGVSMKLVLIPAGRFAMGSPKGDEWAGYTEMPQHDVTISKAFFIGACEVTQEQYEAIVGNNPSPAKGAKNPVESVSWNDAVEFCKKVSAQAGVKMRLPTEAEWEYACRAGSRTRYGFGDKETMLGEYAWFDDNSDVKIHPVGQKKPNAWGLYDMHGNVLEWCSDWRGDYAKAGNRDPKGADSGSYRVVRGGSCYGTTRSCRSASHVGLTPGRRESALGFRVAVDLK